MKTKIHIALAFLSIFSILTSAVFAEYSNSDRSPINVRGDIYVPLNSELRSISTLMIQPTLEYNLKFDNLDRPTTTIGVGWRGGNGGTTNFKQIPISINVLKWSDQKQRESAYFSFGLSYIYSKYEEQLSVVNISGTHYAIFSTDNHIPTASIAYGKDFGSWFVEFKFEKAFTKMSRLRKSSVDPSMLGICVGSHITL